MLIGNNNQKDLRQRFWDALNELETAEVEINGICRKPSEFYTLQEEPPYVTYHEDCPDSLKDKIESIVKMRDHSVKDPTTI